MGVMGVIIPLSSTTLPQNGGLLKTNNLLMSGYGNSSSSTLTLKNQCNNGSFHYHPMMRRSAATTLVVHAKSSSDASNEEEPEKKRKQNLFESVTEALDFAQVRSVEDAQLLDEAREATKSGSKMTREQYSALRRKIGGTYKDFFKSYVEVEGPYVEEGWVDKTCKVCKKDTSTEPRQKDYLGRYVHVACLDNKKSGGNFFTKLFS